MLSRAAAERARSRRGRHQPRPPPAATGPAFLSGTVLRHALVPSTGQARGRRAQYPALRPHQTMTPCILTNISEDARLSTAPAPARPRIVSQQRNCAMCADFPRCAQRRTAPVRQRLRDNRRRASRSSVRGRAGGATIGGVRTRGTLESRPRTLVAARIVLALALGAGCSNAGGSKAQGTDAAPSGAGIEGGAWVVGSPGGEALDAASGAEACSAGCTGAA